MYARALLYVWDTKRLRSRASTWTPSRTAKAYFVSKSLGSANKKLFFNIYSSYCYNNSQTDNFFCVLAFSNHKRFLLFKSIQQTASSELFKSSAKTGNFVTFSISWKRKDYQAFVVSKCIVLLLYWYLPALVRFWCHVLTLDRFAMKETVHEVETYVLYDLSCYRCWNSIHCDYCTP